MYKLRKHIIKTNIILGSEKVLLSNEDYDNDKFQKLINSINRLEFGELESSIIGIAEKIYIKGTNIKCSSPKEININENINFIPSLLKGKCKRELLVCCFGKDNLDERLRVMLYNCGIYYRHRNKNIVFVTTKWDTGTFSKHKQVIDILKAEGMSIRLILMGEDSVSEIL